MDKGNVKIDSGRKHAHAWFI